MGNQNKTRQYTEITQEEAHRLVVDLDDIVEHWIWQTSRKTKALSRFKREQLLFSINWKHVTFVEDNVQFSNSSSTCSSRSLLRSHFENRTTHEQLYNFNSDRSTSASLNILFTQHLCASQESSLRFHLPKHLEHLPTGIPSEQSILFGRNTSKEYTVSWSSNSQLRVPPRTRLLANLIVDEEEWTSDFSIAIHFFGRIIVSVAARRSPNICLKFIVADIVDVLSKAKRTRPQLAALAIIDGRTPSIAFTLHGQCALRYGVKQRLVLNEESLERLSSCCSELDMTPSAPSEYCNLTTSENKTDELIRSTRGEHARL